MADVTDNRSLPFSPFSVNTVTEVRRPPYGRGKRSVIFFSGQIMLTTNQGVGMKDEWWYASGGARKGPVKFEFLRGKMLDGSLSASDLVWTEGMSAWTPVSGVSALHQVIQALPPELPPSTAPEPPALSVPAAPWRRFFARFIDLWVIGLPTVFLVAFFLAPAWPGFALWLQQPGADVALGFLVIPLVLVIEAVIFELFGTTIGKGLLGVQVTTAASKIPTPLQYLYRQFGVYWTGLGTGFPLVSFFTYLRQYRRLKAGMTASYDEGLFKVTAKKIGFLRYVAAVAVVIVLLMANGILQMMPTSSEKGNDKAVSNNSQGNPNGGKVSKSQPTVSESQRTNPENLPATTSTGQLSSSAEGSPPPKKYLTEDDFDKPLKIPNNVGISANAKGLAPDGKLAIEIINSTSNWRVERISVLMIDAQQYADFLNERRPIPVYSEQYLAYVPVSENKLHLLEIQTNWKFDRGYLLNVEFFGHKN